MIRSYKYLETAPQLKLQEFILAYFGRIESESSDFDDSFFGDEFLLLVNRHPDILKQPCIDIYTIMRGWSQEQRIQLCEQIRKSNDIEGICQGMYIPPKVNTSDGEIWELLDTMFKKLYDQVLDGKAFKEVYSTSLKEHFDNFSKLNADITLCPICGISELKKHTDTTRDQYDHYLPKSLYPFSSVNFKNLVPVCKECNSFDVKADKDTIGIAANGKLFFPYDATHQGISITFHITNEESKLEDIQLEIEFSNPDNKNDEVESWKKIYNIESRYQGYVRGRIEKWYRHYWGYINKPILSDIPESSRVMCYWASLEEDEAQHLNFIRRPALTALLSSPFLSKAAVEARQYS